MKTNRITKIWENLSPEWKYLFSVGIFDGSPVFPVVSKYPVFYLTNLGPKLFDAKSAPKYPSTYTHGTFANMPILTCDICSTIKDQDLIVLTKQAFNASLGFKSHMGPVMEPTNPYLYNFLKEIGIDLPTINKSITAGVLFDCGTGYGAYLKSEIFIN